MESILNILYTPLDTIEPPVVDIDKLLSWAYGINKQLIPRRMDASGYTDKSVYPWHIVYAKNKGVWEKNFNTEFPELANFFSEAYGLTESEVQNITLLPVRPDYVGIGFWHADPDEQGLRVYLVNDETDNFLRIRPTVEPYDARPVKVIPNDGISPHIQTVEYSAKMLKPNQTFFLNNVRAIHAANVTRVNSLRIAVIISGLGPMKIMKPALKELILRSAEKYSDYAIHWTLPVSE